MQPSILSLASFAVVSLAFAGCLGGGEDGPDGGVQLRFPLPPAGYPSLEDVPLPAIDGEAIRHTIATFSETFAPRVTGTRGDDLAEQWLVAQFRTMGYEVHVLRFHPRVQGQTVPASDGPLKAIVATKAGAQNPDHWIAWGGHYDTSVLLGPSDVPQQTLPTGHRVPPYGTGLTVQGAYDNGSGTGMTLEMARVFANVTTNKTVAAILFNGEEEGLLASQAFARWYQEQSDFVIDHFTGFDMVGINWPAPGRPLLGTMGHQFNGTYMPLMEYVVHDVVGVPRNDSTALQLFGRNHRNSDEMNLDRIGIPTMRFAGMIHARDYWAYHKANDTMETIHKQAGGPQNFAAGLATVAQAAYWTLVAVDKMAVTPANA